MPTSVCRLPGQPLDGPSGVRAQSIDRASSPATPPPDRKNGALSGGAALISRG
jgi:hypothetical protein